MNSSFDLAKLTAMMRKWSRNDYSSSNEAVEPYLRFIRKLGKRGNAYRASTIVYMEKGQRVSKLWTWTNWRRFRRMLARVPVKKDSPWNTWWEEMARKSPLRRLAKWVPLSPEFQKAAGLTKATKWVMRSLNLKPWRVRHGAEHGAPRRTGTCPAAAAHDYD